MKKISLPKIGIRPVIDGRRMGVRESLEEQTMNMAKATAALLTEKLRHACGAAVECVISDTCIAGMAEAAACEEKFSSQNVGLTITVTPCWCATTTSIWTTGGCSGITRLWSIRCPPAPTGGGSTTGRPGSPSPARRRWPGGPPRPSARGSPWCSTGGAAP